MPGAPSSALAPSSDARSACAEAIHIEENGDIEASHTEVHMDALSKDNPVRGWGNGWACEKKVENTYK